MQDSTAGSDPARTIGQIAAADFRTARVFERHGIDFAYACDDALTKACDDKGLDLAAITAELGAVQSERIEEGNRYSSWPLPFLVDYIFHVHHAYLKANLAQIAADTRSLADSDGERHPELIRIADVFGKMAIALAAHMREEDESLFPAVKRAQAASVAGGVGLANDRETIRASVLRFYREHREIGDAVGSIRVLSSAYSPPHDGSERIGVTYRKLAAFDDDLHKHVHLENNLLFPKAARL